MKELRLDATLVNSIGELKKLGSLITLSLENAQITDPSPLAKLVNMEYLNLAGNYVNDLTPLKDLPALKTIQLNNNFLDLNPVDQQMGQLLRNGEVMAYKPTQENRNPYVNQSLKYNGQSK